MRHYLTRFVLHPLSFLFIDKSASTHSAEDKSLYKDFGFSALVRAMRTGSVSLDKISHGKQGNFTTLSMIPDTKLNMKDFVTTYLNGIEPFVTRNEEFRTLKRIVDLWDGSS